MIKCTITFYGEDRDKYGMPDPFHSYFIVASKWESDQSGIATIVPLTDAPLPPMVHFPSQKGGPRAALALACKTLKQLPENKGLKQRRSDL